MKIAMSGASGYVGQHLTRFLTGKGHEIIPLGRSFFKEEGFNQLCHAIQTSQIVINLAGAPINKRWTKAYKQELQDSRIPVTRQLVRAMKTANTPPELFISTSAVGYYSSSGIHDEHDGQPGSDFLARLCQAWEREAHECPHATRLVITRFGIILSEDGGVLQQMIRLQHVTHLGASIGNGQQPFPWISMQDLCNAYDFIIQHPHLQGTINLTSPEVISQKHFARELAKAKGIRLIVPLPKFIFHLLYSEGASFITSGQAVRPSILQKAGFIYIHPTIKKLLTTMSQAEITTGNKAQKSFDNRTIQTLDLPRYMGRWYEIARYENRFEKGMTHVTATYTRLSNGKIRVENEGYRKKTHNKAIGRAKQPDPDAPGKLKVSFFLWFYSDYYILELDTDYNYVVVGSSTDKYLWILSREKNLPNTILDKLLYHLRERGYDTNKLIFTKQD